jgi:1-acyl-sn-glycerol-3-phosphate acyltransferase
VIYWIMRALFIGLFRLLGAWEVRGHQNLPREGAVLVAPNHLSYLDPPLIGCALQRPGWFMAKAELFEIPGFAWLIRGMHAYPVKRGVVDRPALKRTLDYLENGEVVCVFPEGTRSATGDLGPIESGIGMLALKTGSPIVPVGIRGTDRMLPRDARRVHRAKIRVQFGSPIEVLTPATGRVDREACEQVAARVGNAIRAILLEMDAAAAEAPGAEAAR